VLAAGRTGHEPDAAALERHEIFIALPFAPFALS